MEKLRIQGLMLFSYLILVIGDVRFCYAQEWSTPVRISPMGNIGMRPRLAIDQSNKIWCRWWNEKVFISYCEGDTWTKPDTVIPRYCTENDWNLIVGDITIDKNNRIFVTSINPHSYYGYFSGSTWLLDSVPESGSGYYWRCVIDSSNNFWVFGGSPAWRVFCRYYNGQQWSDTLRIAYGSDVLPLAATCDEDGKLWILLQGMVLPDTTYSFYLSYYSGATWHHIHLPIGSWRTNFTAHPDGSLWICTIYGSLEVYVFKYDTSGFSTPVLIYNAPGESSSRQPHLAVDSEGKVWCAWSASMNAGPKYLFFSVWNGITWSLPAYIDTLEGKICSIAYDSHRDRVWAAWESMREGYSAVYASYAKTSGVEEGLNLQIDVFLKSIPNPCYGRAEIKYELVTQSEVTLKIYNLLGELVSTLIVGKKVMPGIYSIYWNGKNDKGEEVKNGVYFAKFDAGEHKEVKKLILMR